MIYHDQIQEIIPSAIIIWMLFKVINESYCYLIGYLVSRYRNLRVINTFYLGKNK